MKRFVIDILMTVLLLFLMAYSLVGEVLHEWLGIGMFVLFILHHILNDSWRRNVFKGRYTPFRILQIGLVIPALASMIGSMVSGIVLSRYALSFLPVGGGQWWARTVHMLCAYWGIVIISLHIGLHWNMVISMTKRMLSKSSVIWAWISRIVGLMIAGYGVYAFAKRQIGSYMFLKNQFVFFDYEEPLILFLIDYMAVMGLFMFFGHYLSRCLRRFSGQP